MVALKISLLGTFHVEKNGRSLTKFDSAKVRALLAYLTTERDRPHGRETLAAMLWPDHSDRDARHSLSQALSNLRRLLADQAANPPFLLISRETIQWNSAASFSLDVLEFEKQLTAVNHHRHPTPETCLYCLEQLQQASALYQGEFLQGFSLDFADLFEEWALLKRSQLERDMVNALQRLTTLHEARGHYKQARHSARRQLTLDHLHEPAHQQLIRAYALDGRRAAALRQYRELTQKLAEEFGVAPSSETIALYETIKQHTFSPPATAVPPPPSAEPAAHLERAIFVVREAELSQLQQTLDTAVSGHGRILFIAGETGSGKTALLQEMAWRGRETNSDLVVAHVAGNAQTGRGDPYLPFRELLHLLTGAVASPPGTMGLPAWQAQRLQSLLPITGQALVNLGPDLLNAFVSAPELLERASAQARYTPEFWASGQGSWLAQLETLTTQRPPGDDNNLDQSRLFSQYLAVLKEVAKSRPLLLLLDDMQWADAGSINLLFHLGRNLKQSRLLIVCAYRAEDIAWEREGQRHPLAPVVNEFKRAYGDIALDLDAATQSNGRQFVKAFIATRPNQLADTFCEALYQQTSGQPLFVVELLRDLIARGDLVKNEQGLWVEKAGINWQTLPARVEGTVAERIERLPPALQEALAIASVEGETFSAELIARVQAADEREMVQRLSQELNRQHHLVIPQGTRQIGERRLSLYRFRHALFQKYVYGRLDKAERAYLHEDVGQVLETIYGQQTADIAVQLARHFQKAGNTSKAITYFRRAGDKAMRLSAYQEAADFFTQALALLKELPGSPERVPEELRLQMSLGISQSVTAGFAAPQVEQAFGRARALGQQIGDAPELFPTMWGLFYYYLVRSEDRAMKELAAQLHQMAVHVDDPLLRPVGSWAKGVTHLYAGDLSAAFSHLDEMVTSYNPPQAQAVFRYVTDPGVAGRFWSAWTLWLLGYPDQAASRCYEALALAQQLDHPFSLAFAMFTSAALYQFRREPRETLHRAAATVTLAQEYGFVFFQTLGEFFCGWALTEQGDLAAGMAQMQAGLREFQASGSKIGLPHMLGLMAEAHGRIGQPQEGLTLLAEALAAAHDTNERHYEAELHRLRGELSWQAGLDVTTAVSHFQHAITIAQKQKARSWELRAALSWCRLLEERGEDTAVSHTQLATIYHWFSEGFTTPDLIEAAAFLQEN